MYTVEFTRSAKKDLKKLDKPTVSLIIGWIRKNLEGTLDPRVYGKSLTGNRRDQWRYRVGDYRILANIDDERIIICVVSVGHRKNIYEKSK